MILGIVILKKQNNAATEKRMNGMYDTNKTFYMEQSSAMVQKNVAPQKIAQPATQGKIICRKCYSAIPEHMRECPCCQAVVDRR